MKVFLNPGHDRKYDSGAIHRTAGTKEADIAFAVGTLVESYLLAAGVDVDYLQSDNLCGEAHHDDRPVSVCSEANNSGADIFVSIHCNAFNMLARGTETLCFQFGGEGEKLANCIQKQIVDSIGTVDRGVKERQDLAVLRHTDMPAVLVEMAFIDNDGDHELLTRKQDDFAKAIARGITDYEQMRG